MEVPPAEGTGRSTAHEVAALKRALGNDRMPDEEAVAVQNALNAFAEIICEKWLADTSNGVDQPCEMRNLR